MPSPFPPQPPLGFRPAGQVDRVWLSDPPRLQKRKYTGARLLGVQYEKKVQEYLLRQHEGDYLASPWFSFQSAGSEQLRWCQPDGILFDWKEGRLILVEVKYQHTALAWWQLRHLYFPVVRALFPERLWTFEFCEITKWYDPQTAFPCAVSLARSALAHCPGFKVHIWKP